ncbi:MAG TPA: ribosome maturation factor RimM [Anaerolineaceae bacterium]
MTSKSSDQDQNTGSFLPGEPVFLLVGKIRRPHGVQGEVLMELHTDFPERLRRGKLVYCGERHTPLQIESIRPVDQGVLVSFKEYSNPEEAGVLRNQRIYIQAKELPQLPEGEYYHHDLLGMNVVTTEGVLLGILEEIIETGANDVYLVRSGNGTEILIPAVEIYVKEVDLEQKRMVVNPPEWE